MSSTSAESERTAQSARRHESHRPPSAARPYVSPLREAASTKAVHAESSPVLAILAARGISPRHIGAAAAGAKARASDRRLPDWPRLPHCRHAVSMRGAASRRRFFPANCRCATTSTPIQQRGRDLRPSCRSMPAAHAQWSRHGAELERLISRAQVGRKPSTDSPKVRAAGPPRCEARLYALLGCDCLSSFDEATCPPSSSSTWARMIASKLSSALKPRS